MSSKNQKQQITGTVQYFDTIQGNGFIRTDQGKIIYINYSNLPIKDGEFVVLHSNQKIKFDIFTSEYGQEAKNIIIL